VCPGVGKNEREEKFLDQIRKKEFLLTTSTAKAERQKEE
jgi:hypothetical protein